MSDWVEREYAEKFGPLIGIADTLERIEKHLATIAAALAPPHRSLDEQTYDVLQRTIAEIKARE
jgi:hypothetical protein